MFLDYMVCKGDDVVLARTEIDYRRSARMGRWSVPCPGWWGSAAVPSSSST